MEIQRFKVGILKVEVYPTSKAAAGAAAQIAAHAFHHLDHLMENIGVIFAADASQFDTLRALTAMRDLPWNKVLGFHMDDYIGIAADHPASFRRYLRENLTRQVEMKEFSEIDGTALDLQQVCLDYAAKLRSANPQLCLLGFGENGHLAFNDPDEANFADPLDMKVVHLDTPCRQQ